MNIAFRHLQQSFRRTWRREGRGIRRVVLTIAILGLYFLLLFGTAFGTYLDGQLLKLWYSVRGARPVPSSVSLIAIDDKTYRALGLSTIKPFPRHRIAELLEKLTDAPPRLVVLDIFFLNESDSPEADIRLANALSKAPVAIGEFSQKGEVFAPYPLFAQSAKAVVPLEVNINLASGLATELWLPAQGEKADEERLPLLKLAKRFSASEWTPPKRSLVNYYGPPSTIPTISFDDALNVSAEDFRDKVVFVGFELETTFGSFGNDSFATPASGSRLYGVEYHATVYSNLLDHSPVRRLGESVEDRLVGALLLLITYFALALRPAKSIALLAACAAAWALASYLAFSHLNLFLPGSVYFITLLPLLLIASALFHYRLSAAALKQTEEAFGLKPN